MGKGTTDNMALARNDNAPLFAEGTAGTLRLIAYLAVAITLMVLDHRNGYLEALRKAASHMIEPIYRLAAWPVEAARDTKTALAAHTHLVEENRALQQQLLVAQARISRLNALAAQNAHLKELLEVQKSFGVSVQLAKLIDIDLDPFRHRIILDAGSTQGVNIGQPIIDAHGVMGQVVEVLPQTSKAVLITDPDHAIPILIERTGLRTVAYGTGATDQLVLPNIPISADVKVGDSLVTSGLGGRFPAGFPVGEIREVKNDSSGMFAAAIALPAAALNKSGEVLLLSDLPEPYGPPAATEEMGPPNIKSDSDHLSQKANAP